MLDRLSLSLVSLPEATYDVILILADAKDTCIESQKLLNRDVLSRIVRSMKPGGRLRSQDGKYATDNEEERREAILAGLLVEGNDMIKPEEEATQPVALRFGNNRSEDGPKAVTSAAGTGAVSFNLNGKRKSGPAEIAHPSGVGYVEFSDDFGVPEINDSDDDLIDEDTLLDEEDVKKPVLQRK